MRKLTQELEADLRSKIDPAYKDTRGTESYERDALLAEIDRLREVSTRQKNSLEMWAKYARTYRTATHSQWDACVMETTEALLADWATQSLCSSK